MRKNILKFKYLKGSSNIMRLKMHGAHCGVHTFVISEDNGVFFASKAMGADRDYSPLFDAYDDAVAWCEDHARKIMEAAQ